MIKVKTVEEKTSPAKKNITVTDVEIINGEFTTCDEEGEIINIVDGIKEALPEGVVRFDIKISVEIPESDEFVDLADVAPDVTEE